MLSLIREHKNYVHLEVHRGYSDADYNLDKPTTSRGAWYSGTFMSNALPL